MTTKAQREAAALRRLKLAVRAQLPWTMSSAEIRNIYAAIDAWHEAERKRGGR